MVNLLHLLPMKQSYSQIILANFNFDRGSMNLTSVKNSSAFNCYMKVFAWIRVSASLGPCVINLKSCRLTSSTRPKPPTPSVARNERSFRSNSAISFGIFFETFPMLVRFSNEAVTLRNTIEVLRSRCYVS